MRVQYLIDRPADDVAQVAGWFMEQWGHDSVELWLPLLGGLMGHRALPTTFVAVEDGKLIGTASLVGAGPSAMPGYSPWLSSVLVPVGSRGRGVTEALLRRVEAEARALGFSRLYYQTTAAAEPYERLGWRWIGSTISGSEPTKVMALDLASVEQAA
jgi:GNAT superfamily N-acetyltransferase